MLAAWFPTDEDRFRALEKDGTVKRRFEEAAAGELQQGWDRGRGRDAERDRQKEVGDERAREQERRENEVRELLKGRVEVAELDRSPNRA